MLDTFAVFRPRLISRRKYWLRHLGKLRTVTWAASTSRKRFYLTDWPRQAHWLPVAEREWVINQLEGEKRAKQSVRAYTVWQALRHRDVLILAN